MWRNDHTRARELAEESLARARRLAFPKLELQALGALGDVAWADGDREQALALMLRSAELAEETGFAWGQAGALLGLAEWGTKMDRLDDAERWARRSATIARSIEGRALLVEALAMLAAVAMSRGDVARAGLLWGAVEGEEARSPLGVWEKFRDDFAARVVSPDERFSAAREEGRKLSLDEAVERALASAD